MKCGVVRETYPGERRVALVPAILPALAKAGVTVIIEAGAGQPAGFPDKLYQDQGRTVVPRREDVFAAADVLVQVARRGPIARPGLPISAWSARVRQSLLFASRWCACGLAAVLARGVNVFAMEMIPRITRAQSMDALSSMATVAGYKAALLAAATLPKMFPMMTTAAGTLLPARALILGVGVAGLQAIAASRRLGAVVEAYDVRPDVKDQAQSLGAKFLDLPLETAGAQDAGGYAKAFDESFYRRQRELLTAALARRRRGDYHRGGAWSKAPLLITTEMVEVMQPGSVIVDLAAERGGNCGLTKFGETVVHRGVTILGPDNLPATVPAHASQMYAKNVASLLAPPGQGGQARAGYGRRDHARDAGGTRRRDRPSQGARGAARSAAGN